MMELTGKQILVVEDNVMNRVVYQITLGVAGAYIEFDRSGRDALKRVQSSHRKWDIIILDLMLPHGHSGYDIFEAIRELPDYNDVPIVAISASEPSVAIPQTQKLGFSGFIAKPIDEAKIVNQVCAIMEGEQVWYDGLMDF